MTNLEQIQPDDIDTGRHFWEAFGHMETEFSARWIVLFCQARGNWSPFTEEDLETFYNRRAGYTGFWFNRLLREDQKYIQVNGTTYTVTPTFIERCSIASPKSK